MVMKTRMLPKQITSTTSGAVHTVPSRQYLSRRRGCLSHDDTEPGSLPGSDCCRDFSRPPHFAGETPETNL